MSIDSWILKSLQQLNNVVTSPLSGSEAVGCAEYPCGGGDGGARAGLWWGLQVNEVEAGRLIDLTEMTAAARGTVMMIGSQRSW